MAALPGMQPTIYGNAVSNNRKMEWVQAAPTARQTLLGNGFVNIAFADPIFLLGASQIAVRVRYPAVGGGVAVLVGIAWSGDDYGAAGNVYPETSYVAAAPAGGEQRFNPSIATFGPYATNGSYSLLLPCCAYACAIGMYSDGAPAVNTLVNVQVDILLASSTPSMGLVS